MRRQDVGRRGRASPVCGREGVHNVSLCASISGERSITVMEVDGNWANVERERIALTEADNSEAKPSRW